MINCIKIVSALLLASAVAFAQNDVYGTSGDGSAAGSSASSATDKAPVSMDEAPAPSESANDSSSSFYGSDDSESSDESSAGSATATGDQWEGFNYEEAGLTQWEFQQAKEAGISREKLTRLVELGVHPSEYLQKPWERLGVTEEAWLSQRAQGMEDSDIDRSYRNHSGDQSLAYWSLLVPSLYQWEKDDKMKAIWIDVLWGVGVGGLSYYAATSSDNTWIYWLIPVLGAHLWSFADAFLHTQWDNNPDANQFSFGIGPSRNSGVAGIMQWRF